MPVRWLVAALAASLLLVGSYAAAGGLDYKPDEPPDPCQPRSWPATDGVEEIAQQIALSALDGAACELDVSREQLALAFTSDERLDEFGEEHDLSDDEIEDAARRGILRAIDDGERSGELGTIEAFGLRLAAQTVPINRLIELARTLVEQGFG